MTFKEQIYKLQCGRIEYEVICPLVTNKENVTQYLVLPEYLIPNRPYPIYVYLHAIELYSTNEKMGQREAAEKTRIKFELETFSHTTLGRAMKKLEEIITLHEPECVCKQMPSGTQSKNGGIFPSVEATKKRKETVLSYIKKAAPEHLICESSHAALIINYKRPPYSGIFIEKCHKIAAHIYLNNQRLLL